MRTFGAILIAAAVAFGATPEPDGLTLASGFLARVVAEGLGAIRHLAARGHGSIYVSTPQNQDGRGRHY